MIRKFFRKAAKALLACLLAAGMTVSAEAAQKQFTEEELAYMPATEQLELFKAGTITPSEVLEAQIARVEKYNGPLKTDLTQIAPDYLNFNGKVNALCYEKFAEARKSAKEADARYKNGTARPLEGITVGVKNEIGLTGWRVDCGSALLKDNPLIDQDDSAVYERLRNAGAIFVFSTTVPEFYISYMTWTKMYGVTRNPWNEDYTVGGSSGGSAAALAAGFCTLATGSDMGGSIRIPASMCGLYGFKSPFGRIPTSDNQFETFGPLAKTFKDMALMQNIIAGPSHKVMSSIRPKLDYPLDYESIKGKKVAVVYAENWYPGGCDKEVNKAIDQTIKVLKKAGAQVDVLPCDLRVSKEDMGTFFKGLLSSDLYEMISLTKDAPISEFTSYAGTSLRRSGLSPQALVDLDHLRKEIHKSIQETVFRKGYTALIMPTMATSYVPADLDAAPDKMPVLNGQKLDSSMENVITPLFNLMGTYPVVDVPVYIAEENVPIGVQVIGNTYDDLAAFAVASAISENQEPLYKNGRYPDFRNAK